MPEMPNGANTNDPMEFMETWRQLRVEIKQEMTQAGLALVCEKHQKGEISDFARDKMVKKVFEIKLLSGLHKPVKQVGT